MYITNSGASLDGGKFQFLGQVSPEANVSSITFSGLNGDNDQIYAISYQWKNPLTGSVSLKFQPNGQAVPNGSSMLEQTFEVLGGVLGNNADNLFSIATLVAAQQNSESQGAIFFSAATAAADGSFIGRSFKGQGYSNDFAAAVGAREKHYRRSGFFNDTQTLITSITLITSDGSNAIGVGSDFRLWKPI